MRASSLELGGVPLGCLNHEFLLFGLLHLREPPIRRPRRCLRANGYTAVLLWLGDYISMDDDVGVEDVAKRMEQVVRDLIPC